MSQYYAEPENQEHTDAGRLLSERLRIARETVGPIVCPVCHVHFDATHVMKCPECRTFIDESFQAGRPATKGKRSSHRSRRSQKTSSRNARLAKRVKEKVELELDFFTQGYMEYKG